MFDKIVLHVPHASVENYSYGWTGSFLMWPGVKALTDWHTDILFDDSSNNPQVTMIRFPYSRFYVDVERLDHDPLEAEGRGKFYTRNSGWHRTLSADDLAAMNDIYNQHHARLAAALSGGQSPLLIDCHSFSNEQCPEIAVCIGYNDDASFPGQEVIDIIRNAFESHGYKVGINAPYSNAKTLNTHPDGSYKSVMIELNKRIYMNETTTHLLPDTSIRVKRIIQSIYGQILKVR